ncbi:MAG: ribonuclease Y [Armatimonadota bacterium]
MNTYLIYTVIFAVGIAIGIAVLSVFQNKKLNSAKESAKNVLESAQKEAENLKKEKLIETKDEVIKMKSQLNRETEQRRGELQKLERRILQREENIDKKYDSIDKKEKSISQKEQDIDQLKEKWNQNLIKQRDELEKVAKLSSEEAKKLLLKSLEGDLEYDIAARIKDAEEKIKEEADQKAKRIISTAIQRYASDQVVESTVSVVPLPNDEMKGRIIGREGRNIRIFENLTGINLIIDDTPEAVILSGFDPVRREIARQTLEKLIVDGRIHPARIEEMYKKCSAEMDQKIIQEGDQAVFQVGLTGIHPELVKLIGRLKWRTSFGQNVLQHSLEVASLTGSIAAEIGANVNIAKRAGLLHDIGKAVDAEVEGPHALIGAKFAEKYNESQDVVHCIAAHHEDEEQRTVEAVLIQSCDAISASRPGARRESIELYIKRLEKLEAVANSFEGVDKSFAIQAGREIRIMVKPEEIDDLTMSKLARDIVKKVEDELDYPGQIKITVIRETRTVELAK